MTIDRDKEREVELESAMYTNCLLLGLDPAVLGFGASNGAPRVGLFRHSNPKLGEVLLHFILSSLRGPIQSAKDFDKVWPIFDNAQSREFRKIVQGIINELESQGALPRSNSRVSSLATCCGQRFVELLWQLSFHALREVHRRTFAADVAVNPLPASLTDVSYLHAATLLPVTKARIALERRRFLKNANTAVHRQATWSSLAHDMTAEFRGLCAEEAYLQQELEKLQDLRSKVKLDVELWDDCVSSSLGQNSRLVSKATRLWESLLARKSQHEILASGPIEDLIAHREHRYRISGSSLLAAMDQSSNVPRPDMLSVETGDSALAHADDREQMDGSSFNVNKEKQKNIELTQFQVNDEALPRMDDRSGRVHPTVDVAEILRRWTHALQRVHKQSVYLAKANDGEGPELLRRSSDSATSGHAESLAATLAEHRQHLASIQVLKSQLKEVVPAMKESVSELKEQVESISCGFPMPKYDGRSRPPVQGQSSGRVLDSSADEAGEANLNFSSAPVEKVSPSPALKLPHLFSLTPNSSGKGGLAQKRHTIAAPVTKLEILPKSNVLDQASSNNHLHNLTQDSYDSHICYLRHSVREAALSSQRSGSESSQENSNGDNSEHFFVPLSDGGFSRIGAITKSGPNRTKQLFDSRDDPGIPKKSSSDHSFSGSVDSQLGLGPDVLKESSIMAGYDNRINEFLSMNGSNYAASDSHGSFYDLDEAEDQVFSPPFLTETSFSPDAYEDLLGMLVRP